jgi:hypothetical protein
MKAVELALSARIVGDKIPIALIDPGPTGYYSET